MLGDNYADDLPQMPIVRTADGILFYGQGPVSWEYKKNRSGELEQLQVQHPYAQAGFYFITNDARFTDIGIEKASNVPTGDVITTYTERLFHEKDSINPGETGRSFLGESFKNTRRRTFRFDLDGLVAGSQVKSYTMFAARTPDVNSSIIHRCNGKELPSSPSTPEADRIKAVSDASVHYNLNGMSNGFFHGSFKTFSLEGTDQLEYTLEYSCSGTVQMAHLDFLTINYKRNLALRNGSLAFGLNDADPGNSYRVSGCGGSTRVWNVSNPFAIVEMNVTTGEGTVTFSPDKSGRQEFVAFNESGDFLQPKFVNVVSNQNIHGEPVPDMIILAPSAYLEQARRVAALHEKYDKFRVLVLDHEKVFNEFSSGTQDAMAYRRLCKMFYDRGVSEDGHRLGYLLLMGNGSYDNRLIGTNSSILDYPHLLTWQSLESNNDDKSFTSDDYFAILDDGSNTDDKGRMNISVGRMIVKSVSEARTVVNKLVDYVTKPIYGSWKNQVLMVADNGDKALHMEQSEGFIVEARNHGGDDMVFNHVYIDAFNAVSNGGSDTYPDARTKMFTALQEGVLWWNYIGHASTQNWTGDGLMMRSDVETQLFYRHLPVLYAASCEYTRFDNTILSSGEHILLNPNGGVIASISFPRVAQSYHNGALSANMGKFVFSPDEFGMPRRIGDILRLAKNSYRVDSDNNRRFFCFGDPAMRLALAAYTVQVDTINGRPVDDVNREPFVFKARESVKLSGKIVDLNGELAANFDGAVVSILFGPEQSVTTHGYGKDGIPFTFEDRPNRLAVTMDTVIGGHFTVRIIIPSEVNNEYDNYRPSLINLYAYDSRDSLEAKGMNADFYIYGYEDEEVTDTIGPRIITFGLNDDNFFDGCDVNESPLVLATVSDESGVNFSSAGIGHSMTLTLDGTISYNDLVSYYTPQYAEEGTLGSISYQLSDLSAGRHTLRLRVWDVYNNVSEKTIGFNVVNGLAPEIADVFCSLNPAGEASFYVQHNRPDAVVGVTIEVYDLMGRLVWNTTQSGRSDMYTTIPVTWDLTDMGGRRVPRGIYVYRATITTDGIKEATKAKKLAVAGG